MAKGEENPVCEQMMLAPLMEFASLLLRASEIKLKFVKPPQTLCSLLPCFQKPSKGLGLEFMPFRWAPAGRVMTPSYGRGL
jgi:hypothetical protein